MDVTLSPAFESVSAVPRVATTSKPQSISSLTGPTMPACSSVRIETRTLPCVGNVFPAWICAFA